jgi:hypothetical protein
MLSEKGLLKDTPVIKLLLTVFEQGMTGILYIKRDDVLKVLYFNRGKIIWAISNSEDDKLENILAANDVVDPVTIRKVKMESRVSESIGKLLVEKGLITLEELIDCSKDQLRRIIVSTLKWKDGGFQFIKDAPPERLLSLDLNVTEFIIQYILDEVEISDIWKEIGSLQLELIKTPDEEKIARYHLNEKQTELLNGFDGERKLETILSRYSGGHRESLLKIIYFFMVAGLLIKKAFDLSDASVFDTGEGDIQPGPSRETGPAADADSPFDTYNTKDINNPPIDTPSILTREKEFQPSESDLEHVSSQFGSGSLEDEFKMARSDLPDLPDEPAISSSSFSAEPPEEKKRIKLFNVALIMVFLILVFGGVILLLLPWLEDDNPTVKPVPKTENADIIKLEEPAVKQDNGSAENTQTSKNPQDSGDTTSPPRETKTGEKQSQKQSQPPDPKAAKTEEPKKKEVKKEEKKEEKKEDKKPESLGIPGKSALSYFREGSFITAADVWRRELTTTGIKYTIMLEMDCMKESVFHAYRLMKRHKDFFILNRKVGRRTCYLVMWGKFFTEQEAGRVLKSIPNYFWKQKDPPEIVELSKYF